MKVMLPAYSLLLGCALSAGPAPARPAPPAPAAKPSPVRAGYERAVGDLRRHWWDGDRPTPRVRPTRGANSSEKALDVGTADDAARAPSFWQMAQYANVQYWDWRLTRSAQAKADVASQWAYVRACYSDEALSSGGKSAGLINVSDDAAWVLNYLVQVHEVTGDRRALTLARAILPNVLDRFADPNAPRVKYDSLSASPHGILYATAADDPDHQGCSTAYEVMAANAALYVHTHTGDADCLAYAAGTFAWTTKYLRHPERGYYYCELDIAPTVKGVKNAHFLKPVGDHFGPPVRGLSAAYGGGTLAVGVAAARLYKATGKPEYLAEARRVAADFVRPDAFLRPGGGFVNDRDAWTGGYWFPHFAAEVLPLPGVDPAGAWGKAVRATALAVVAGRTAEGHYGADWTGPERNPLDGSTTWAEQAKRGTGSGRGMALPGQIMTSSNSVAVVAAALAAEARPADR